jgi:hypothetical protein
MQTYFWFQTCPVCRHQGRLIITRDDTHQSLYLHCDECEQGWRNPDEAHLPEKSFLTLAETYDTSFPTAAEIDAAGWRKCRLHSFSECPS